MPYKDPEIRKQKARENYLKNKDRIKIIKMEWDKKNKEKLKEIKKRYVKNNPEKRAESIKKYNQSEKGKLNKHKWYRNWAEKLGVLTWEEWCKTRTRKNSPYPKEFNKELKEYIKQRDNHKCVLCGMIEPLSKEIYKKSLAVHHIDYNKNNCSENNLITTCVSCNIKVNYNKDYWKIYFGIQKPKVCIVVPTIRTDRINTFLNVWEQELKDYTMLLVEDNTEKTIKIENKNYKNIIHLSHEDIDHDLGDNSWIISKKTSAVCSYGFYKAYKMGFDVVIKMDDDILIRDLNFVESHLNQLFKPRPFNFLNPFVGGYPRGFPYHDRVNETFINYGLADYVLDYDAQTQILNEKSKLKVDQIDIPNGVLAPICGMNIAVYRDVIPALYFGLQGAVYGLDRFDDIWAGIFVKKVMDMRSHVITIGSPVITHGRLSNIMTNLEKEAGGMCFNEELYQQLVNLKLKGHYSYKRGFKLLADKIRLSDKSYESKLKEAMNIWADLF